MDMVEPATVGMPEYSNHGRLSRTRGDIIQLAMRLRKYHFAVLLFALTAFVVRASHAHAQQSNSSQTPTPATAPAPATANKDTSKPADDSNAFPEDVSRKAADKAQQQKKAESQPDRQPAQSGNGDNAFPEETSRKAADAAKAASEATGVSSSSDYADHVTGGHGVEPNVAMSHIHSKDPTKEDVNVGTYYLQSGDYVGAYARFKEAATLHPENTDAMFGLAEAARHLKKTDEAIQNYRVFLDVVPSGSKAKEARKALASLDKPH